MNLAAQITDLERRYASLLAEFPELADDDELRADVLEGETDLHTVLSRLVNGVAEANMMLAGIKARRQELADRADRFERRVDAFRALITRVMETTDTAKLVLPEATLSLRDAPARLIEISADETPEHLWRVKREPDKKAIADALKEGADVPGWTLSNGGKSLTIRSK